MQASSRSNVAVFMSTLQALNESIEYGQQLAANNPDWVFISPFDDPLIW